MRHTEAKLNLTACAVGLAVCLGGLLADRPATAQDFTLHAEAAGALWVDEPQSDRFLPGFYVAIRPGVAISRVVALQWSYALLFTPAADGYDEDGTAHFLMAGVRVKPFGTLRPASEQLGGLFVDFNMGYVRTGELDRFGFDAGLGYGFQVASWLSLGPVARYGQILQANDTANQNPNDAQFVTFGLDLGFGPAHEDEEERAECPGAPECPKTPKCPECVQNKVAAAEAIPCTCSDRDRDGVCDIDDRCPMEIGPPATLGCPIDPCSGAPLIVLVQFEYDSAKLPVPRDDDPQTMDPVLDAVAKAIAQDPSCRVCIVGHASEEGPIDYNQTLSSQRATAVQGYLSARGLAETRMPTAGLGARCQIVPESTRPLNRRVEFRRLQEGESCPTDCLGSPNGSAPPTGSAQ